MKKAFIYLITITNILGLCYLLGIGCFSHIAQDDYAFLRYLHQYGFTGALQHWYFSWQGRFAAHILIQTVIALLYDHHINLVFYYAAVSVLGIYALFTLIKNMLQLKQIDIDNYLAFNLACFIFTLGIYNSFELNTFYWLNVSAMYVAGTLFFLLGFAEILNQKTSWLSYLLIACCFFYTGASSENFAVIAILILGVVILQRLYVTYERGLRYFMSDKYTQKTLLAMGFCFLTFVMMMLAPGNKIRLATSNAVFNGYEKVPLSLAKIPAKLFVSYIALLINMLAKTPLLLMAGCVFIYVGQLLPRFTDKRPVRQLITLVVVFLFAMGVFIVPIVYAQASLGPGRSYMYLSFFLALLTLYIFLTIGNLRVLPAKLPLAAAVFALLFYSGTYIHDLYRQLPAMKKYAASDNERLQNLALLKQADNSKLVVLDSLYAPYFVSYSNRLRNVIKDQLRKHTPVILPYESAEFSPVFYNEIGIDSSKYQNTDMVKALHLPFPIAVKK